MSENHSTIIDPILIFPYFSTYPAVPNQTYTGVNCTQSVHISFVLFCTDLQGPKYMECDFWSAKLFWIICAHLRTFSTCTFVLRFCILSYVYNINIRHKGRTIGTAIECKLRLMVSIFCLKKLLNCCALVPSVSLHLVGWGRHCHRRDILLADRCLWCRDRSHLLYPSMTLSIISIICSWLHTYFCIFGDQRSV